MVVSSTRTVGPLSHHFILKRSAAELKNLRWWPKAWVLRFLSALGMTWRSWLHTPTPVSPSLERVRERVGSRTKAYVSSSVKQLPFVPFPCRAHACVVGSCGIANGRVEEVKAFLGTPVSKTQLLQSLAAHRESYRLRVFASGSSDLGTLCTLAKDGVAVYSLWKLDAKIHTRKPLHSRERRPSD